MMDKCMVLRFTTVLIDMPSRQQHLQLRRMGQMSNIHRHSAQQQLTHPTVLRCLLQPAKQLLH